jgi:hypothetical protein
MTCKPYDIPKILIWEAWLHVKANQGAAGVRLPITSRYFMHRKPRAATVTMTQRSAAPRARSWLAEVKGRCPRSAGLINQTLGQATQSAVRTPAS